MLINFTASNFRGECRIDSDFAPYLVMMNRIAVKYNITVVVNSAFRSDTNVPGAIVVPAKKSNHLVGHAIDCNLIYQDKLYNSVLMQSDKGVIRLFINEVIAGGLRWGGAFKAKDPVHFDDALNIKAPGLWGEKYKELRG